MSSDPAATAPAPSSDKPASEPPPARDLGPLRMVWREVAKYPRQLIIALLALTVTATATLAIPAGFKLVIDR